MPVPQRHKAYDRHRSSVCHQGNDRHELVRSLEFLSSAIADSRSCSVTKATTVTVPQYITKGTTVTN